MIPAIVLAAGQSTRMGAHKLLLPLGGRPVVAHVVTAALASRLRPVVVVLGHDAERVRQAVSLPNVRCIVNAHYRDGLSTSLHAGLGALPAVATGVVIALGDQPGVSAAHLDLLAATAANTGAQIIVSEYHGQRGNPVYFARACFDELYAVTGDSGGRQVIARHLDLLRTIAIADASAAEDLDTPADYQRLRAHWPDDPSPSS